MKFTYALNTDKGIVRETNQDSLMLKRAKYQDKDILMAIVCDGMGGLQKGEVASAQVIRSFNQWFMKDLEKNLASLNWNQIASECVSLLTNLNERILAYGAQNNSPMGTTFTMFLCVDKEYIVIHVGDTRLYRVDPAFTQITEDHTFVHREYLRGNITLEEEETHPRRNVLLQCVGASKSISPQLLKGDITSNTVFMMCSDGFRHEVTSNEIETMFHYDVLKNQKDMEERCKYMTETVKNRNERDNISVILIKIEI